MSTVAGAKPLLLAVHPVLMASAVQRSISFFHELGFSTAFLDDPDDPKYAGLQRDNVEIHIQWNELLSASSGQDRPVYRFLIQDVEALYREFLTRTPNALSTSETTPWHAPAITPWGTKEFHIHDPDGNGLQFYQLPPFPRTCDA